MSDEKRIDDYSKHLSRMLRKIAERDRSEIIAEIRSHLEVRAEQSRLDEAFAALGSPQKCARRFLDELMLQEAFMAGGFQNTIGALTSLASRRIVATLGLFMSAIFFAIAIGLALTAVVKIAAPEFAGLWIDPERNTFTFGISSLTHSAEMTDILGFWTIPVALAGSVSTLVCGQWLGRFFIRLMLNRSSRSAS